MPKTIDIGCFVSAQSNDLGPGKVVEIIDSKSVSVEYFYSVARQETRVLNIYDLERGTLTPKTRCYFADQDQNYWQSGIVCNWEEKQKEIIYKIRKTDGQTIRLPESDVFIKCGGPTINPIDLLSSKAYDTGFNHTRRSNFLMSLLELRSAARGMTAVSSSKIALLPHQVEVVRRVVEDPVQRYLLADEVGLGKTIEAGAIIRQYLLDHSKGSVLVFVPPLLIEQWQKELSERFHINGYHKGRVHIYSVNDVKRIRKKNYGLIVMDEAHHVAQMAFSRWQDERSWFEAFAKLAHRADRLLLLSATPVLNNEHSFLAMLNLLDPDIYRLSDINKFIHIVQKRQDIGQLLLSFKEEKGAFILKKSLEKMRQLFPNDKDLENLLIDLEKNLSSGEPKSGYAQIIRAIRVHITENYRLHQRIMMNRRENVDALTGRYHRGGQDNQLICQYDEDSHSEYIYDLLNEWRETAVGQLYQQYESFNQKIAQKKLGQLTKIFFLLLESSVTWEGHFQNVLTSRLKGTYIIAFEKEMEEDTYHLLREVPLFEGEKELLESMLQAIKGRGSAWGRLKNLITFLEANKKQSLSLGEGLQKCVIFTSYTSTCREIVRQLAGYFGKKAVSKFHMGISADAIEREIFRFRNDPECFILVCDWSGEEGRNLQFADIIIHFDLPWAPNRIEQRIGRLDRIGRNKALNTYVFTGPQGSHSLHEAWFSTLDEGFGIFNNSIASLQFFTDEKMPQIRRLAFMKGAGGVLDTIASIQEEIKSEKVKIYEQYALDEINVLEKFDIGYFDTLQKVDQNHFKIQQGVEPWLCEVLGLEKEPDALHPDIVKYQGGSKTMVPASILSALDPYISKPGTYSREVAESTPECDLYRTGQGLFDIIENYTKLDDRGKTFIIWRHDANWDMAEWAGFRFDFIIEADIRLAKKILKSNHSTLNLKALRNQAEAYFQPKYKTIYVDIEMSKTEDTAIIDVLNRPFKGISEGGNDFDLTGGRLHLLEEFVDQGCWADLCHDALRASKTFLQDTSFINKCNEAGDKASRELESRVEKLHVRESKGAEMEQKLARALVEGIRAPMIRLDSAGFIILSARYPLK